MWIQVVSIGATAIYTAIGTFVVVLVTKIITRGLRVEQENEIEGLDSSIHGERAFENWSVVRCPLSVAINN
ncbi:hypothetical protein QUF72_18650 [Desulfobacterales bacterium HSG2]|nr:hypothetical protein [Desulfobacterales bacterium HSG2]